MAGAMLPRQVSNWKLSESSEMLYDLAVERLETLSYAAHSLIAENNSSETVAFTTRRRSIHVELVEGKTEPLLFLLVCLQHRWEVQFFLLGLFLGS